MSTEIYRYCFPEWTPLEEVEASLVLALLATESLHGEVQVRLDAAHLLEGQERKCVIDAGTPVGRDFNRLFAGFLRRDFGEESFRVERIESTAQPAGKH